MGFYGNVSSSNKTAFSFDITYSSRTLMETNTQTDGVFIGRYVLVEYDAPPISAYYNPTDGLFYNTSNYGTPNLIKAPKDGQIYLDISQDHSPNPFYMWKDDGTPQKTIYTYYDNGVMYSSTNFKSIPSSATEVTLVATGAYVKIAHTTSPYTMNYNLDVTNYGRGYDSTAWRKTYDVETNKYRYVLVSELNTIVPNFHLIPDPPSSTPSAPYFDRDTTTNIDYFLHDQAAWGQSIRTADKKTKKYEIQQTIIDEEGGQTVIYKPVKDRLDGVNDLSDERITRMIQTWSEPDSFGNQTVTARDSDVTSGDIYYNKIGFDRTYHHITPQLNGKSIFNNTINYDLESSGRLYYDTISLDGNKRNGEIKPDTLEWYIHLPILGDAICELWDTLYSYDKNEQHYTQNDTHLDFISAPRRFTDLATRRGDTGLDEDINGSLVQKRYITYQTDSAIGAINEIRDMLGYALKYIPDIESTLPKIDDNVITVSEAVTTNDFATLMTAINNINYTFNKQDTMYLYYVRKADTDPQQEVKEHFFAYAYSPQFVPVNYDSENHTWYYLTDNINPPTRREFAEKDLYYLDNDNIYKKVNKSNYGIQLSNGERVEPIATFYAPLDRWKMTKVENIKEDSIYGLMTHLHELLGDTNPTLRTMDTIAGCINILKDMIGNVDSQLQPHRLTMTNDHGQIVNMQEYDGENFGNTVEYPYFASVDNQETLDCGGHWRLPVDYKLETFAIKNNAQKYFDSLYWGNSTYHELNSATSRQDTNCDTVGNAFNKISEELSDIQHNIVKRITDFYAEDTTAIKDASVVWHCKYDLHAPWKSIQYKIDNGERQTIVERVNNQDYLTQFGIIDFTNNVTMGDTDIVITLYVMDERQIETSQSITIKHLESYQYVITNEVSNITLGATQKLYNELKNKFSIGQDQYLYIKVPSADYRLFIDNQYGGFDLFDAQQHIYRTTNTSLGTIEVEIYE